MGDDDPLVWKMPPLEPWELEEVPRNYVEIPMPQDTSHVCVTSTFVKGLLSTAIKNLTEANLRIENLKKTIADREYDIDCLESERRQLLDHVAELEDEIMLLKTRPSEVPI